MRAYSRFKFIGLIALFVLPLEAQSASFDCKKSSATVERLICNNPELSEIDSNLSQIYAKALTQSSDKPTLKKQQREWLQYVRNKCGDDVCLKNTYIARIAKFDWTTTNGKENPLCEEFRIQISRKMGLSLYALPLDEINQQNATHIIRNVDVDGDGISDQILLFLSGSASRIPPDNSEFSVVLSKTGKEYKVEAQGLYAISYKSRYYLLTHDCTGEDCPVRKSVNLLNRSGLSEICTFECGLPYGDCSHNE